MKIYRFAIIIDSCQFKRHALSKREAVRIRANLKREFKDSIEFVGDIICDDVEMNGKGLVEYLDSVFRDY